MSVRTKASRRSRKLEFMSHEVLRQADTGAPHVSRRGDPFATSEGICDLDHCQMEILHDVCQASGRAQLSERHCNSPVIIDLNSDRTTAVKVHPLSR